MLKKIIIFTVLLSSFQAFSQNICEHKNTPEHITCVTALDAAKQMGKGFNLGQMFENAQHESSLYRKTVKQFLNLTASE